MVEKVYNPATGKFWYYKVEACKLSSKSELKQLIKELKKLLRLRD